MPVDPLTAGLIGLDPDCDHCLGTGIEEGEWDGVIWLAVTCAHCGDDE